jgi:hypothetical protein
MPNIEEIADPNSKFATCQFRSKTKRLVQVKRCSCQGGNYTEEHYYCDERQIQRLNTAICERCIIYKQASE